MIAAVRRHGPGLALCGVLAAAAVVVAQASGRVGSLMLAAAFGSALASIGSVPTVAGPGIRVAARPLMRVGVALLGLRVGVDVLRSIGPRGLAVVICCVIVGFAVTFAFARTAGIGRDASLLLATGTAICGASAIVAVAPIVEASDDDVALALATITLCGSVLMVGLPLLPLPFDHATYGVVAGASVHEVAQVVAAAGPAGAAALAVATVVKLARVALLVPLVAILAAGRRRTGRRVALPWFLVVFVLLAAVRSLHLLPQGVLDRFADVDTWILAIAMAGLGLGIDVRRLARTGTRALAAGAAASLVLSAVACVLVAILY